MAFVHLHVHTQYSILDGASRIKSCYSKANKDKKREKKLLSIGLVDKAIELQMPAIAITDHGNMFGAIEFYIEAKAKNITPIIGCEVYVAPKSRFDKKADSREGKSALHLVLLAKDKEGYDNLKKLVSFGYTEGFYYKPRIDHELIEKYNKGIIALSACIGGEIPTCIRMNDYSGADKLAKYYQSIFGNDFYIELQDQNILNQRQINASLFKLAKENGIQTVVTNDVHYVERSDSHSHDILLAVQTKSTISNKNRMRFGSDEFYLKSEEEMREKFPKMNNAFLNTVNIAEKCRDLDILTKKYFMPKYPMHDGETEATTLRKLCIDGLNKRFDNNISQEMLDRLYMELSVIGKMGFEGYFLIVQDFINYAKSIDISVGPGRGSAAGSIVSYATGITDVNPLQYNLLFERFLNPDRLSMPDIDIDFQDDRRDEIIQYVKDKYGENNVSQIATFSALHGRSVIRDVCRAMEIELSTADRIAKMLPNSSSLGDAYEDIKEFRDAINESSLLKDMYNTALKLEGLVRSVGLHAAGVVIADRPIIECAPIYQDSKTGNRACQYEMEHIESVGLIKIDFLGIKNLRLIKDSIKNIKEYHNIEINMDEVSMNDDKVFELFREANTMGIFQFESDGMRNLLTDIAPTEFSDLVSAVALYRPGPLSCGMGKSYADRKNKREPITYPHDDLKPVLRETQGVLIYQEQIMGISRVLGGFTPGKADELRKAMGKKKIDMMDKLEADFMSGGLASGYDKKMLSEIYNMMRGFGEYGFNKSHSVCYAIIAYHQAYLKAHYPLEYYIALLNTVIDDTDKIRIYLNEIHEKNIEVINPSVTEGTAMFSQRDGIIVYALHAIKGVGYQAALSIEQERDKNGIFKSIEDFAKRVNTHTVNKKVYEALIKSGAFSSLGYTNQSLLDSIEPMIAYGASFQAEAKAGQNMLFDSVANIDSSSLFITKKDEYDNTTLREHELETVGFNLKYSIFSDYPNLDLSIYDKLSDIDNIADKGEFYVPCIITNSRDSSTKKGAPMFVVDTEDMSSIKTFFIIGENISKFRYICMPTIAVLIHGRREQSRYNDKIFTNILDIYSLDDVLNKKVKIKNNKKNNSNKHDNKANIYNNTDSNIDNNLYDSAMNSNMQNISLDNNDKYVLIHLLKKTFDDMDLHCLQDTIEKHPGLCPVVVNLVDDNGAVALSLGDKYCVNANSNFINSTHEGIRSLLKISLQNA